VNHLARAGFDVFNLDLRGHGRSRHLGPSRSRDVHDYIREDLPVAISEVQAHTGGRPVFLIGHSLGGLLNYAAAASLGSAVAGIVSIGSPYHFARGSYSLSAVSAFVRALGHARIELGNAPLRLQGVGRIIGRMHGFAESSMYPLPLRGWHVGAVEPEVLSQHLDLAFDHGGLAEVVSMFRWGAQGRFGGPNSDYVERFEKLDLPLLVIAGANDDLAPPASVRPGYARSASTDKTYRTLPLGHIDLLVGRDAPKSTWRIVSEWLTHRAA
jgi:alpha-beta hydrolase superfamily lysophospholipase